MEKPMNSNTFQITTEHCIDFPISEGRTFLWVDGDKEQKTMFLFTAKEPILFTEICMRPMAKSFETIPMEHVLRIQIPSLHAARVFKHALVELVQTMELEEKARDKNVRL